ncbi:prepilin-type N-terminal cleavage/methylation domain-containing protein [Candidatus Gracilibacteria bacterium]|nr:prepilin-type N-terminal cleavage/methylation domain-containing protein [Candidatus Gracilibacteria bacterium]
MKFNNKGFTLIEIVISVSIFSVIMITMISIYILASETSLKSDINRAMHENVKSVITDISENVMKNGIIGVSQNLLDSCDSLSLGYKFGNKLCVSGGEYILAKEEMGIFIRVDDLDYCKNLDSQCYIVKNGKPLTNSMVTVKELRFYLSDSYVPKITINIVFQPTIKSGVKPSLIEQNKLIFQTTISERPF